MAPIAELSRSASKICFEYSAGRIFGIEPILKQTYRDRNRVTQWLHKILKNNKTLNDLKLRNEFLRFLKENVQNGKLEVPFDQDPPKTTLKALARQLPGYDEMPVEDDEEMAMLRFLPAKHGGFLLPKPLPAVGAYIHIAAACSPECPKNFSFG